MGLQWVSLKKREKIKFFHGSLIKNLFTDERNNTFVQNISLDLLIGILDKLVLFPKISEEGILMEEHDCQYPWPKRSSFCLPRKRTAGM